MKRSANLLLLGGALVLAAAQAPAAAAQSAGGPQPGGLTPAMVGRPAGFDTLQTVFPADWSAPLLQLGAYQLTFSSNEVLAVTGSSVSTIHHFNGGGWGVRPVAYADQRLLVLATVDSYFTPRRYRLGEINLATGRYQDVAIGQQIEAVRYSTDRSRVLFTKNGAARQWMRPGR